MICRCCIFGKWCQFKQQVTNNEYISFWGCNYLDNQTICPEFVGTPTRYISREERYNILKRQKWCCNICGKKLKYGIDSEWDGEVAHIDHIHPFSEWETYDGDINEISNLQALCPDCNMRKHNNKIN